MVPFSFASQEMRLLRCHALYWAEERALLVADLHLEKASFFARHGQMLPPYDSRETLGRLASAIRQTGARRVFCLGDNFHDAGGQDRLEPHAAGMLDALVRVTDWVWITGNHDDGSALEELAVGGLILRHQAHPGETRPELSGHFHPRLRVATRGRRIARRCAVVSDRRMILPAYGALTGGMDAAAPEIIAAMQPAEQIEALTPAPSGLLRFPLWQRKMASTTSQPRMM